MEKLAKRIASKTGEKLGYDEEKIAVMAYGLIGLFQFLIILVTCAVIGLILGFFWEAMIIFWGAGMLRRVMGGAHSSGFYSCLFISILCICGFAFLCSVIKYYSDNAYFLIAFAVIYCAAFGVTYKLAPVQSPNKPIRSQSKRMRLRKSALITLSVFAVFTIAEWILNNVFRINFTHISVTLAVCVLWQTFLMLPVGAKFISAVDRIFIPLNKR